MSHHPLPSAQSITIRPGDAPVTGDSAACRISNAEITLDDGPEPDEGHYGDYINDLRSDAEIDEDIEAWFADWVNEGRGFGA